MRKKEYNCSKDIFEEYIRNMGRTVCLTQAEIDSIRFRYSNDNNNVEETLRSETKDYTYWYLVLTEILLIASCTYGVYWVGTNLYPDEFAVEKTICTFALLTFTSVAFKVYYWLTR